MIKCPCCEIYKNENEFYLTATKRLTVCCKSCYPLKDYLISLQAGEIRLFKRSPAWKQCLEYWGHSCVCCGRKEGNGLLIIPDHWKPFAYNWQWGCTVPTNIVPLCRSSIPFSRRNEPNLQRGSCNSSKNAREGGAWLIEQLGEAQGRARLADVEAYFELVRLCASE